MLKIFLNSSKKEVCYAKQNFSKPPPSGGFLFPVLTIVKQSFKNHSLSFKTIFAFSFTYCKIHFKQLNVSYRYEVLFMAFSFDTYESQGFQSYVLFEEDERDEGSRPTFTGYEFEETRDGRWLVARGWCLHTDSCRFEPFGYMPIVEGESDSALYERADAFFNDYYECDEPYPYTKERGYARL